MFFGAFLRVPRYVTSRQIEIILLNASIDCKKAEATKTLPIFSSVLHQTPMFQQWSRVSLFPSRDNKVQYILNKSTQRGCECEDNLKIYEVLVRNS